MKDLAERVVRCDKWRWMPGMRALSSVSAPMRIHTDDGVGWYDDDRGVGYEGVLEDDDTPDLEDPATIGCLEALVFKAYRGRGLTIHRHPHMSVAYCVSTPTTTYAPKNTNSYAEALVCALETA